MAKGPSCVSFELSLCLLTRQGVKHQPTDGDLTWQASVLGASSFSICVHSVEQEPFKGDPASPLCQLEGELNMALSAHGRSKGYHPQPQRSFREQSRMEHLAPAGRVPLSSDAHPFILAPQNLRETLTTSIVWGSFKKDRHITMFQQ